MEGLIDRLEDQAVEAVLSAPGVRSSPSHPTLAEPEPPGRSDKSEREGSPVAAADNDDDSMVSFGFLDLLDLDLFSRDGRFRFP
ncbi:uncharacterized protein J7T54_008482 [Emericellopsis cladophorae]|uniref:Uncharacterized protein n=1 Tax=Emericellopsis cladophorae TaxID=2686198 RepID=A0A9P9XVT0_9HYPO|nr:uncharacterized protein J7T54_008482 [Emericellopsis cladophorae]KAI6778304.1 hypothetical protein J7T54_008482 [Emericellopsis cladophorae]